MPAPKRIATFTAEDILGTYLGYLTRQITEKWGVNDYVFSLLTAVVEKDYVKLANFKKDPHKPQSAYLLITRVIRERSLVMHNFIEHKRKKFNVLPTEIKVLKDEAGLAVAVLPSLTASKQ